MKVKLIVSQDVLDKWNVPDLETGDVLTVEESDDGFAYLIVDSEYDPDFWLAIPKSFAEVLK